jgi:undecaprenyl diphosphate synthase
MADSNNEMKIPRHLAVILDGNGRWAKAKGLPRNMGHVEGAKTVEKMCEIAWNKGIEYFTVYAFSTENWSRPDDEVHQLMELFVEFWERYDPELEKEGIRVRFTGDIDSLPENIREVCRRGEERSKDRQKMQLIVAFNYGGRREIENACRQIARDVKDGKIAPEDITEQMISDNMYMPDVPDPELIIRPSGELRLSNFLLWESAYSELWTSECLWPDFGYDELTQAFRDFAGRDRRFGGLSKSKES